MSKPRSRGRLHTRRIANTLREHYDGLVEQYIEVFFDDLTDAPWLDRFLALLSPGSHVLDVGCGPGNFAKYMADRGLLVTGIDISREMINAARRLVPNASFEAMNMSRLRYRANTFDGLLAAYSFLHIPKSKAESTLLEFRRVVLPGGIVCLMVKEGEGEHVLPSPLIPGETCYVQFWRESDLLSLLQGCGFEVTEVQRSTPKFREELQFEKILILTRVSKPSVKRVIT